MSDPLTWSPIRLGRWFGTTVKVHIFLILFVVIELLMALLATKAEDGLRRLPQTACWLSLLIAGPGDPRARARPDRLLAGLRSGGRAPLAAGQPGRAVAVTPHERAFPGGAGRSGDQRCPVSGHRRRPQPLTGARFVWNPFGNPTDSGAPWLADNATAAPLWPIWIIGWFGYLNYLLFLVNLLPALPFDGGRMFRAYLSSTSVVSARDNIYAPWTARATAAILFLTGLVRLLVSKRADGITVIMLALLIELLVRTESRMLEDGGYFEDGVFGYDFSEGYTSLENSAAKVRPYKESALPPLAAAALRAPPAAADDPRGRRGTPDGRDPRQAAPRGAGLAHRGRTSFPGSRQHPLPQPAEDSRVNAECGINSFSSKKHHATFHRRSMT